MMALSIRSVEAGELAAELAALRKTNKTEAIVHALRSELRRRRAKRPLAERLEALADETLAMARQGGHAMTKDEIDAMWGQ